MTYFTNGHTYATAISLAPPAGPAGRRVPFIEVEMAAASGVFEAVVGKLDTGAFMTLLDFQTARFLGILDPKVNYLRQGMATAANDTEFPYYVHRVIVTVDNTDGPELQFVLEAGFSDMVKRNLFGIDWLRHMCVAVDLGHVHLLKD